MKLVMAGKYCLRYGQLLRVQMLDESYKYYVVWDGSVLVPSKFYNPIKGIEMVHHPKCLNHFGVSPLMHWFIHFITPRSIFEIADEDEAMAFMYSYVLKSRVEQEGLAATLGGWITLKEWANFIDL